jgi:CRISPR type IV-associated protein Csf3
LTPLRVTARMAAPVCYYGDGMHLDGIVALGYWRLMDPEKRALIPPLSRPWALDFELPLERWTADAVLPTSADERLFAEPPEKNDTLKGQVWGWKASAVCAEWLRESLMMTRKRPAVAEMARYSRPGPRAKSDKVLIASGRFKAWNKPYPTRLALKLVWYCVGDPNELRRCLDEVTHLGKLGSAGLGRILEWTVEECDEDYSVDRGGQLMRTMPLSHGGLIPTTAPIRPPYHHPSRRVPAVMPAFEELRP